MSNSEEAEGLKQALAALVKMLMQWNGGLDWRQDGEPFLSASGYSSNEAAMRVLERYGLISITSGVGRGIRGKWTEAAREFGADPDFIFERARRAEKQKGPLPVLKRDQ
jgi:hypothetical protein